MKKILITGAAGFIGSSLVDEILQRRDKVVGIDNLNTQYNPRLKLMNIQSARSHPGYTFYEQDIRDHQRLAEIFLQEKPDVVVHIAGSTGMTVSMLIPDEFYSNNVNGTYGVLESCRIAKCANLIFISTASVYGDVSGPADENYPLSVRQSLCSNKTARRNICQFLCRYLRVEYNYSSSVYGLTVRVRDLKWPSINLCD